MIERINDCLFSWASILEGNTREQAITASTMPFIFPHMALMSDAHLGKGATVGSVIPTMGAIMPAAVGVDIGCGMMAVRTQFKYGDIIERDMSVLHKDISAAIPLSVGKYNTDDYPETSPARLKELDSLLGIEQAEKIAPRWHEQLGSLGSGNHFIEVSLDENNDVWLFLHSGSRGVGNKLAMKHIKIAQEQCKNRFSSLPNPDLAYLVEGDQEFDDYITALNWAQRFAFLNREEMMDRVVRCFERWHGVKVQRQETINCHHNYTNRERHFGKTVWLSRKGAISAEKNQMGLIPGSMGDLSYVVKGLGNPMALNSAPHGAGRNHSRSVAKKLFTREDLNSRMEGVAWGESDAFLDEHPNAYKPIDQVMKDAAELVQPVHTLRQIVNVKGN